MHTGRAAWHHATAARTLTVATPPLSSAALSPAKLAQDRIASAVPGTPNQLYPGGSHDRSVLQHFWNREMQRVKAVANMLACFRFLTPRYHAPGS
jgi:hypothetical protein